MSIWQWAKEAIGREWRKPLKLRKRRPGEPMFDTKVTTGFESQNKRSEGEYMPKVAVSSKVSPAIPSKRKRKAKKLTPQQVAEIKAKAAQEAEGKAAEPEIKPKEAQPQKHTPITRQEKAAQSSGSVTTYPATRQERALIMRRQPMIGARPPRISQPRPRISRF